MSAATSTIPLPPRTRPNGSEPRRFDLDATEQAVHWYEQARRFEVEAHHAAAADPALEKWATLASMARMDAEEVLVTAILAWDPDQPPVAVYRSRYRYHHGRGVRLGSKVYFALPRTDTDPGEKPDDIIPTMVLAILDAAAIHQMSGAGSV